MEVKEILLKINDISVNLKDLLKETDKNRIVIIIQNINNDIKALEKEDDLNDFVINFKKILSVLATSPNKEVKKFSLFAFNNFYRTKKDY